MVETLAVVKIREPEVVGYMNLFDDGDYWEKVQGCEKCEDWVKARCCNQCKLFYGDGCIVHGGRSPQLKPFECVVKPVPNQGSLGCRLVFRCVKGKHQGKLRHVGKSLDEIDG